MSQKCKFIYNFNCVDLLRFQGEPLKIQLEATLSSFLVRAIDFCVVLVIINIAVLQTSRSHMFCDALQKT